MRKHCIEFNRVDRVGIAGSDNIMVEGEMSRGQMQAAMESFTYFVSGDEWLAMLGRVDEQCGMPNSAKLLARAVDELSTLVETLDDMYDDGPNEPSRFLEAHALITELRSHIAENL